MKKRNLTLLICVLSCIALIGFGFATWVITKPAEEVIENGSFVVEDVQTKEVIIECIGQEGTVISFGAPAGHENSGWLTNVDGTPENLKATFTFKLTGNLDLLETGEEVLITLAIVEAEGEGTPNANKYAAVAADNYISALPTKDNGIEFTYAKTEGKDDEATVTVEVEFSWGSKFGNENPFIYFNKTTNPTAVDFTKAEDSLNAIKGLADLKFKLTVKPNTK